MKGTRGTPRSRSAEESPGDARAGNRRRDFDDEDLPRLRRPRSYGRGEQQKLDRPRRAPPPPPPPPPPAARSRSRDRYPPRDRPERGERDGRYGEEYGRSRNGDPDRHYGGSNYGHSRPGARDGHYGGDYDRGHDDRHYGQDYGRGRDGNRDRRDDRDYGRSRDGNRGSDDRGGRAGRPDYAEKDRGYGGRDARRDAREEEPLPRLDRFKTQGSRAAEPHQEEFSKVFVGGLPKDVSEQELRQVFDRLGRIASVRINDGGDKDAFAFVEYEYPEDAKDAIGKLNGSRTFGKEIKVARPAGNKSKGKGEKGDKGKKGKGKGKGRDERSPSPRSRSRQRQRSPSLRKERSQRLRLRLERLPTDMDREELLDLCEENGRTVNLEMWMEKDDGWKCATVDFEEEDAANKVYDTFHDRRIQGWSHRIEAILESSPDLSRRTKSDRPLGSGSGEDR